MVAEKLPQHTCMCEVSQSSGPSQLMVPEPAQVPLATQVVDTAMPTAVTQHSWVA